MVNTCLQEVPLRTVQSFGPESIDDLVTSEVHEQYEEQGYWIAPKLFEPEQIERLRGAQERLWSSDYDHDLPSQYGIQKIDQESPSVRQQCNGFWQMDEIRKAVTAPLIGAIGGRLMHSDIVRLWHDQVVYKPGLGPEGACESAGNIGWHQDYGHWQCSSTKNMCTAWIALQDITMDMGPMLMIPGSNKWGLLEGSNTFGQKDLSALREKFSSQTHESWQPTPCLLEAGQVSFHHALTLHGSGPNLTHEPRMCVISHMMPGDTTYRGGHMWHPNLVFLGPEAQDGQPFLGPYFPRIWPTDR